MPPKTTTSLLDSIDANDLKYVAPVTVVTKIDSLTAEAVTTGTKSDGTEYEEKVKIDIKKHNDLIDKQIALLLAKKIK